MGVKFKDYYEVLRVSHTASESDIKNAYRKLARKYHPDLYEAGQKRVAEERFKEINEAYEVLRDRDKRMKYDQLSLHLQEGIYSEMDGMRRGRRGATPPRGTTPPRGASSTRGPTSARGAPFGKGREGGPFYSFDRRGVFSDFFQSMFGEEERRGKRPDWELNRGADIKSQRGKDIEMEMELTLEEVAHGTKRRISVERRVFCFLCHGQGFIRQERCERCRGAGRFLEEKELTVTVPAGVRDGDRIRLIAQGEPGVGSGAAGDRFILVKFSPHPQFSIASDHLTMDLDIMPWEAALGGDRKIRTLFGNVVLKIPVGTRNGQQFRLRGKGLPIRKGGKQDLVVRVKINMPPSLTPEEREHYLELARLAKKR